MQRLVKGFWCIRGFGFYRGFTFFCIQIVELESYESSMVDQRNQNLVAEVERLKQQNKVGNSNDI